MKPFILSMLLILLCTGLYAGDWPVWRGPDGNGISTETDWRPEALNDRPKIDWKVNVGLGHSAVVVKDQKVYTMGSRWLGVGEKRTMEEVVYCISTETGKTIWEYAYASQRRDFPGAASTPAVDAGCVFTVGRHGEVHCFQAGTGKVLWRKDLVASSLARVPGWGFCSSPVIKGNLMILNVGESGIALDKRNGKVLWSSKQAAGGLSTPYLYEQDGKQLVAMTTRTGLTVKDAASGDTLWEHAWRSNSDPVLLDEQILLLGGQASKGSEMLKVRKEPQVVWTSDGLGSAFQTGVVLDGFAYGLSRSDRKQVLQCADIQTGEVKWQQDMDEWGSLTAANGKLIVLDGNGDLIVAEASPQAYKVISQARVIPINQKDFVSRRDDMHVCWTAPVLANGRVYARSTWGELVCVNMR